ncbi:MAG: GntR family transcriptional regulator, partial [Anaerolineales bacterium]|nr:GntR family transcriptional regulator [Anaerolineales bacterium]
MTAIEQSRWAELFKIDPQSKLPLYDRIQRNLSDLIIAGRLVEGQAIPPEHELAELYGVSRLTVRRALEELVRQHWLVRRQGVGTFVAAPRLVSIAPGKFSFTEEMRAIGRKPGSRLLSNQVVAADARIAAHLGLAEGQPLIEIKRVRLADDIPILLENSFLSKDRFPALEGERSLENASLYKFLYGHYQVSITGMDQTLKPTLLTAEQAAHLDAQPGSPSIISEIVAFDDHGQPVEYSWSIASGEKCEFYFRFRRGE